MNTLIQPLAHQILFTENGFTAEMCIEQESLEIAYHLRYKAYLRVGAIEPSPEERFTDAYDEQTNSRTYLIWFEGRPVASIRGLVWSEDYNWQPTPSVKFFETDIKQQMGIKTSLLESNRFVVDESLTGRKSIAAQMLLFKTQALSAMIDQCDYVITAVRPRHAKFYTRMMDFQIISEPISVEEVSFQIQLLATPLASKEKLVENSKSVVLERTDLNQYAKCLQLLKKSA